MNNEKLIAVVGGDLRQIKMAEFLAADGFRVNIFGFDDNKTFAPEIIRCSSLEEAVGNAEAVVLGLPGTTDDETVNTPCYSGKIYIKDLLKAMNGKALLTAGIISDKLHSLAKIHGIYAVDYYNREELMILNAIPSAEGAIQLAMEETPITLHGSKCLVLGFGRIGKLLAKMLVGLGAKVTCTARKCHDLAWINSYGYNAIYTDSIANNTTDIDIIFNTIPYKVLNADILSKINKDCLIIDLASKPGGVDFEAAAALRLRVIWALSLPGKVAPVTAGEIIKATVVNILNELGV